MRPAAPGATDRRLDGVDEGARCRAAHARRARAKAEGALNVAGLEASSLDPSRLGAARRVLFVGKSMSRTRCTGALVDALRRHGVEVRWRNLVTWRRWFGMQMAHRLCRAEFERYRPDVVFVFLRDLPLVLMSEFRKQARIVVWCEEALETTDTSIIDYFGHADILCMSNPARFAWLREHGLTNMAFLMSGFSPRYHRPAAAQRQVRDVAFIGGPGGQGQRAELLVKLAEEFDVHAYGGQWQSWSGARGKLKIHGAVKNRAYAKVCATSRIVLGVNEVNDSELYCSNRTFLTMACRGFHLTHYVPGLERVFQDGEHLAFFRSGDDAFEKIAEWLPKSEQRARVAAAGRAQVLRYHQYYHRVARILQWLEHGLPRERQPLPPVPAAAARAVESAGS